MIHGVFNRLRKPDRPLARLNPPIAFSPNLIEVWPQERSRMAQKPKDIVLVMIAGPPFL
jgi:hypothetical protein